MKRKFLFAIVILAILAIVAECARKKSKARERDDERSNARKKLDEQERANLFGELDKKI